MAIFIILACLLAKINGYRVLPALRDASLYPLYAAECAYWFFQVSAFLGNYTYIRYSAYLQSAFLLSLLFPILRHRLYARAIVGAGMSLAGSTLNRIVIAANAGRMPVYPTLSRLTGYFSPDAIAQGRDAKHVLMSAQTALNFLGDTIDVGFSIMSPGDLLIHGFTAVIVYGVIKSCGKQERGGRVQW